MATRDARRLGRVMVPIITLNRSAPSRSKARGARYFVRTAMPLPKEQTHGFYHSRRAPRNRA